MKREDVIEQMKRAGCGEGTKIPQTWDEAVDAFTRFALADTDKYWPDDKDPLGQLSARKKYEALSKRSILTWIGMGLSEPSCKEAFKAELDSLLERAGATRDELSEVRTENLNSMRGCVDRWRARDKLAAVNADLDRARALLKEAGEALAYLAPAANLVESIRKELGEGQ